MTHQDAEEFGSAPNEPHDPQGRPVKSKALEAVQDAYISVSCLLEDQDWTSTFIDTNNKNDSEIVSLKIKDVKQLEKDLEHIRNQLNIIENFLDPFVGAELETKESDNE